MSVDNPVIDKFFETYRGLCDVLHKYSYKLTTAENTDDLNRCFDTLQFEYNNFIKEYDTVTALFVERKKMESEVPKSKWGKFWSLVKSMWKYKFQLYISGLLLYNLSVYVFPESLNIGLDLLIRIAGAVCFTFAANGMAAAKLLELIGVCVTGIIYAIYKNTKHIYR